MREHLDAFLASCTVHGGLPRPVPHRVAKLLLLIVRHARGHWLLARLFEGRAGPLAAPGEVFLRMLSASWEGVLRTASRSTASLAGTREDLPSARRPMHANDVRGTAACQRSNLDIQD
ncbi:MAG: hypothetical protein U1E76_02610 [Planctomycetota bacterium]